MSKKHVLAGLAAGGVLGVGIAAPTVAFGQDPATPSPSASASAGASSSERGDREQEHADRRAEFAEALAKELGVPTEKVTAALDKLREQRKADRPAAPDAAERQAQLKERLDQAVKDGKLTQEQADAILKAAEAGVLPGPGGRHHHD
ncbi:MAG TPA: hypothetical protein VHN18_05635 [Micromonosporaceae bacterium]|nr:hypothetical protein [Micromonosporaceae bacterium]